MECIEIKYCFKEDDEVKEVKVCKKAENGLHDYEVCEIFQDFMRSVGFSEENVIKYFAEDKEETEPW